VNPPTHLLYLHGFRSSPKSFKAQRLGARIAALRPAVRWWCPQLPPSPRAALALVLAGTADWPDRSSVVVGSSLGGYYATVVAERRGWPAVLLNPAVDPARDLARHIGEQTAFHAPQEHFRFEAGHVDELREMAPAGISRPERYQVLIARGDEVLDWREMQARYASTQPQIIEGSDHALSDFDQHLPRLLHFLGIPD
jgi:predicted esterase YcpF (UPF0227 family)